jgi:hypothetical protein
VEAEDERCRYPVPQRQSEATKSVNVAAANLNPGARDGHRNGLNGYRDKTGIIPLTKPPQPSAMYCCHFSLYLYKLKTEFGTITRRIIKSLTYNKIAF